MKVLNLYCGIGGNRKLWPDDEIEVTAVELNPEIAKIYKDFFPNDNVIVADAHQYLLEHYKEFDFIWSSPPCPSHTRLNISFKNNKSFEKHIKYPDMTLYQEIILLKHFFEGIYVVENVISYYEPLIKPQLSGRHYFWANFNITNHKEDRNFNLCNARATTRTKSKSHTIDLESYHKVDLSKYDISNTFMRKILRNMVDRKLGKHIFNCAFKEKQVTLI